MNTRQAQRFAQALLDSNCDHLTFEVEVDPNDLDPVAEALRELGCDVVVTQPKSWLTVTCPKPLANRSQD